MSGNRLQRLAEELTVELDEFQRLETDIAEAQSRIDEREPDTFELRALGGILHDLYNGAERICLHIAKEIDRRVPAGAAWHRDLLVQMTTSVLKARTAVLRTETEALLEDYRRFRHLVRHTYGFQLDWIAVKPLLDNASKTIEAFATDIKQFIAFLLTMANSDESDMA